MRAKFGDVERKTYDLLQKKIREFERMLKEAEKRTGTGTNSFRRALNERFNILSSTYLPDLTVLDQELFLLFNDLKRRADVPVEKKSKKR